MSAPAAHVPYEKIRDALVESIGDRGLRATSREIGISATGLSLLLKRKSTPYSKTLVSLTHWYLDCHTQRTRKSTPKEVAAALVVLLRHLPEAQRERASRSILAALEAESESASVPLPTWLRKK